MFANIVALFFGISLMVILSKYHSLGRALILLRAINKMLMAGIAQEYGVDAYKTILEKGAKVLGDDNVKVTVKENE